MQIAVIGIDLGKTLCSLAALDESGAVVKRRRLRRESIVRFSKGLAPCIIAMEACCGAHHLGRLVAAQGHEVRLMSPEYVRPYVKAHKNDERDAEAIAEAATRPTMRFVELKAAAQLDMQTLHRARDRLIGARTALINQLRAILLERGITMPQGRRKLQRQLAVLLEEDGGLPISSRMMALVEDMRAQWAELDRRIAALDDEMVQSARTDEAARRLISVPGIGALNATALLAAVGDGGTFARGRDLAAWLGLVPRQVTTGGRPRLVGITKRGNSYLRRLLIHGARAVLPSLAASETPLGAWLRGLLSRTHKNAVVVALANKLARIAWAVLRRGERFHGGRVAAA
jgi:transposase